MTERLLDAPELAELLNVPVGWVRQETRAGRIQHVRLGRYVRYVKADVLAWMESLIEGGTPGWRKHRPTLTESAPR
jgi:excisionase family DNA binding protein